METKEVLNYRGEKITIYYDTEATSDSLQLNEWDDYFIIYDHRDFYVTRNGYTVGEIYEQWISGKKTYDGYWIIPLYAYIHSGVSLSLSRSTDIWDTSFKGFVMVKRLKEWSYTKQKAISIAGSIVKEWNEYLNGEVYGYEAASESSWGYTGNEGLKNAIEDAKRDIDFCIKSRNEKHFKQLKIAIKNRVPYHKRQPLQIT